jgi:FdhD protein
MGRVTRRVPVLNLAPGTSRRRLDTLAVEEPLEIRLNGSPYVVTMRTPGHDIELIHGLLHAEGVIRDRSDVLLARYCAGTDEDGQNTYNVVDVSLAPGIATPEQRAVVTTSACGLCGASTIEAVVQRRRHPVTHLLRLTPDQVSAAPLLLRDQQRTFALTGGLHAAGLLGQDGNLLVVREDVGRHNAVDKVIGWALAGDRLPLAGHALVVSGRASYELTQKSVLAGVEALLAVSAPSSLAVDLAAEAGLTLAGFVRGEKMNIYTHPERICVAGGVAEGLSDDRFSEER